MTEYMTEGFSADGEGVPTADAAAPAPAPIQLSGTMGIPHLEPDELDRKVIEHFGGKIVRKDLP